MDHGHKSQAHWLGPQSAHIPGCLQFSTASGFYPSTQGKFTALQGVLLSLTSLLLASLTPSCTWTFLLSVPDHSSVTNYHSWVATSRTFPAQTDIYLIRVKPIWNSYHVERKKGREEKKKVSGCILLRRCLKKWILKMRHRKLPHRSGQVWAAKILLTFVAVADCTFSISHHPLGYGRVCLAVGQISAVCCCFHEMVDVTYRNQCVHNSNLFTDYMLFFFFISQKNKTETQGLWTGLDSLLRCLKTRLEGAWSNLF